MILKKALLIIVMLRTSSILAGDQKSTKLTRQQYLDSLLVTITPFLASFSEIKEAFRDLPAVDRADLLSQCKNRTHEQYMKLNRNDHGAAIQELLHEHCFTLKRALNWEPYSTARHLVGWDEPINWDDDSSLCKK